MVDLTESDLRRMLELDETLFVEHKRDISGESAHRLARGVASFANTLGGWLLVGVENGQPCGGRTTWASDGNPTLADMVRDRLRGEIDPLPAFEARVMQLAEGSVGVIRIYESADTPHILLSTGSVFVREVAGEADASAPRRPGAKARGDRVHRADQIRSRAQLLELARRGEVAAKRVAVLMDPWRPLPLVNIGLGLGFEQIAEHTLQPKHTPHASVFVRVAPYTLPPRFRPWSTTADGAAAALEAAELLSQKRGLSHTWIRPHVAGCWTEVPLEVGARHRDALGMGLPARARVVIDGAGVVGAALHLDPPSEPGLRPQIDVVKLAEALIAPVIESATAMLRRGEFLGRARCQIDLIGLARVARFELGADTVESYVPTSGELALPGAALEIGILAQIAANALGRSGGLPMWDSLPSAHS